MRRTRSGGKPAYALSSSQQETVETQHSVVDGDATHAMRLSSKERWGGISSRYGWECLGRVRRRWLSDIGVFRSTRASRKAPVCSAGGIVLEPDDDGSQITGLSGVREPAERPRCVPQVSFLNPTMMTPRSSLATHPRVPWKYSCMTFHSRVEQKNVNVREQHAA